MQATIKMITGKDIETLADLLTTRGASLYFACQWNQFETCLDTGAVSTVEVPGGDDWTRGRMRLTLSDVGQAHAQDIRHLPDPRGPIALQFLPAALKGAVEVAVCLRPADAEDAHIDQEAFLALKDVEYLFRYTAQAPLPEKTHLKTAAALEKEFGVSQVQTPEIFCRFPDDRLSMQFVHKVIVDHYQLRNREFRDWVFELQYRYDSGFLIERRYSSADIGGHLLKSMAKILEDGVPTLEALTKNPDERLSRWAQALARDGHHNRYQRYALGLREGTLVPLKAVAHRYFDELHDPLALEPPQRAHLSAQTRKLIDKLLAEKLSVESIARIAELPVAELEDYLERTGRS